jgi:hypothetical protein
VQVVILIRNPRIKLPWTPHNAVRVGVVSANPHRHRRLAAVAWEMDGKTDIAGSTVQVE